VSALAARRRAARGGFTLLEVIVALGIFAIGATAAFALLVAASAAGRRAEHQVDAALIAETVLNDIRADMSIQLDDLADYPRADPADPVHPAPPGANPETRWVVLDGKDPLTGADFFASTALRDFPSYTFDVALTPLPGPEPDSPWRFLVEVEVRWKERGRGRAASYSTLMLRGLTHMENPQPGG